MYSLSRQRLVQLCFSWPVRNSPSQSSTLFQGNCTVNFTVFCLFMWAGVRSVIKLHMPAFISKGLVKFSVCIIHLELLIQHRTTSFSCSPDLWVVSCGKNRTSIIYVFWILERKWNVCRVLIIILINCQVIFNAFQLIHRSFGRCCSIKYVANVILSFEWWIPNLIDTVLKITENWKVEISS